VRRPAMGQVRRVVRETTRTGRKAREVRYFMTSLSEGMK